MAAETLLQILELFPGPAVVVRPDGEVVGSNERMERWIGRPRDALRGRPLAEVLADPPERVAAFLEDCTRGVGKASGTLTPTRGDGAGGECRVEGVSVQPLPDGGEPTLLAIHVIPAGSDADAADAGREGALQALRDEMRRKDEFLGRLAHDLRNPVAAISGALHLARRATSPEDVAWAEDAMGRQLGHLVRQLDDLLDLSRITRGKIELRRERLDGAAAARSAAAAVRPLIDERHHQLTLSTSPGPLALDADPARLEQILVGLLRHAARSTDPGGRIGISVARERDAVVFRVRDNGKGIPPAMLPRAFDFAASVGQSEGGQGIGLMLVRGLAELHGGTASARSDGPGEGSEFTIRMPAGLDATATRAEPAAAPGPAAPTAGTRILVVDDNVDAARGMARLLQLAGHDIRVAHDGRQALEIAGDFRPRFVLLDIVLPGMDGHEVARQLRGDPRHRDAVIIAISGYSEDDYCSSDEAGFDHHLVKPIDYDTLRAIINGPAQVGD
jgi:signal transduction histidine kinase/CheY-like chemotaxis protein